MNLPKTITIGPFDIIIEEWSNGTANDNKCYGQFSSMQQKISIDTSLRPQKLIHTLLHEINHAICWVYNINEETRKKEEFIVDTFAIAWQCIYRDNPELYNFIKGGL